MQDPRRRACRVQPADDVPAEQTRIETVRALFEFRDHKMARGMETFVWGQQRV